MTEVKCRDCESLRIMKFRLDSDWGYGAGSYFAYNKDKHYTQEELDYNGCNRPDIELYHCLDCDALFD
jgi:hypothetical protein